MHVLILTPLTPLKDRFSSYPGIKEILAQAKADKAGRKARLDVYYDDEKLAELATFESQLEAKRT
jgi:hypothetical protein